MYFNDNKGRNKIHIKTTNIKYILYLLFHAPHFYGFNSRKEAHIILIRVTPL